MSDLTITVQPPLAQTSDTLNLTGTSSGPGVTFGNDTITIEPGTQIITITQDGVPLLSELTLPTNFSQFVTVTPAPAPLINGEYVFTCINQLPATDAPITSQFTVSATNGDHNPFKDPTMLFNPPPGGPVGG